MERPVSSSPLRRQPPEPDRALRSRPGTDFHAISSSAQPGFSFGGSGVLQPRVSVFIDYGRPILPRTITGQCKPPKEPYEHTQYAGSVLAHGGPGQHRGHCPHPTMQNLVGFADHWCLASPIYRPNQLVLHTRTNLDFKLWTAASPPTKGANGSVLLSDTDVPCRMLFIAFVPIGLERNFTLSIYGNQEIFPKVPMSRQSD